MRARERIKSPRCKISIRSTWHLGNGEREDLTIELRVEMIEREPVKDAVRLEFKTRILAKNVQSVPIRRKIATRPALFDLVF